MGEKLINVFNQLIERQRKKTLIILYFQFYLLLLVNSI